MNIQGIDQSRTRQDPQTQKDNQVHEKDEAPNEGKRLLSAKTPRTPDFGIEQMKKTFELIDGMLSTMQKFNSKSDTNKHIHTQQ